MELHMTGEKITWSNNHEIPTLEKLDKIFIHGSWEQQFHTALVYKLPREVFDHNPLILITQINMPMKKLSFKFELSWLKEHDFIHIVKKIWKRPYFANSPLDRNQAILKIFKQHFKGCGFNR